MESDTPLTLDGSSSDSPDEAKKPNSPSWSGTMRCVIINTAAEPIKSVKVTHRYSNFTDSFTADLMDPLDYDDFLIHVGPWDEPPNNCDYWDVRAETLPPDEQVMTLNNQWWHTDKEDLDSGLPIHLCIGPYSNGFTVDLPKSDGAIFPYSNYHGSGEGVARPLSGQR